MAEDGRSDGARSDRLSLNGGRVTLVRRGVEVPATEAGLVPFYAIEKLAWRFADAGN